MRERAIVLRAERVDTLEAEPMALGPDILGIVICRLLLPSPPSPKGLIWMMYSSSRGSESSTDVVLVSIMLGLLNWFRLYSTLYPITSDSFSRGFTCSQFRMILEFDVFHMTFEGGWLGGGFLVVTLTAGLGGPVPAVL